MDLSVVLVCSYSSVAAFPKAKLNKREGKVEAGKFPELVSEVTHCHFCHILLIRNESLSQPTVKGMGICFTHKKGVSKHFRCIHFRIQACGRFEHSNKNKRLSVRGF